MSHSSYGTVTVETFAKACFTNFQVVRVTLDTYELEFEDLCKHETLTSILAKKHEFEFGSPLWA